MSSMKLVWDDKDWAEKAMQQLRLDAQKSMTAEDLRKWQDENPDLFFPDGPSGEIA